MNSVNDNSIEPLCFFAFSSAVFNTDEYSEFPNTLKFVFNNDDINLLEYLAKNKLSKNYPYYLYDIDINNTIIVLKNNLNEYLNNKKDNNYYIYIDDINRFSNLLYKLCESASKEYIYSQKYSLLNAVWLRMSPNDYDNVYKFLEHQIDFCNSEYFTISDNVKNYFDCFDLSSFQISYEINSNNPWFETNRKMTIYLDNDNHNYIVLPELHFSVIEDNDKKICYLYGIQNPKNLINDSDMNDDLKDIKKKLRNKYVNYKFILSLHIFIDIMKENGIYDIKVPLLQLFNYDYHISMSNSYKRRMSLANIDSCMYECLKCESEKVVDKEDIISKNKTERLIETFMMIEDIYSDVEILNEPFIEDENLNIKILKKKNR